MDDRHTAKPTSWATVGVLILAFVVLGFALPMESLALGVVGGILMLAGIVMAFVWGLMEDFH